MKVFKFGGASVKDADGIKNLASILKRYPSSGLVVVISAMGKTTNAMEAVVEAYFKDPQNRPNHIQAIREQHIEAIEALFEDKAGVYLPKLQAIFEELHTLLERSKSPNHSFIYDQIVCFGEILSTSIVSWYLDFIGLDVDWLDARSCVKTDDYYRNANLDWEQTQEHIRQAVDPNKITITQGFIGSDSNNFTTTLGREGSDYTAAIFGYSLNAAEVAIWKDVPGVMNGDPRVFQPTTLLETISYREAIELAYYGASVIHPKTLQPLQRKEIPLFVKSFKDPEAPGTVVGRGHVLEPMVPCYILKKNQTLLHLSTIDFSFIVEDNISEIFKFLHQTQMRVELIQNSAISFSVCVYNKYDRLDELVQQLRNSFKVEVHDQVSLYTIRHYSDAAIAYIKEHGGQVMLEQKTPETAQFVMQA